MVSDVHSASLLPVLCVLWAACILGQHLQEEDVLCNEQGCYVVYFQRKTFLESWRSCKERNGNLATLSQPEEAAQVQRLFLDVRLRGQQVRVRVWIGLQRQPRQCSTTHPLRGFTWTTGDQDTKYTNWLHEDLPGMCSTPRCVVMSYSTDHTESHWNFKWEDSTCSLPMDAFLCHYAYKGMCQTIQAEGAGPVLYTTPFNLLSSRLTHVPLGSVASIPCPDSTVPDQNAFCVLREDMKVVWSKNSPYCSMELPNLCQPYNGGCQHTCKNAGISYYCECESGYILEEDGKSCSLDDPCQGVPCDFECVPSSEGYLCTCMEGYLLAADNHSCVDEDECLQSPCPQLCVNTPGSFQCHCIEGYQADETGDCVDMDECLDNPCEHACENTPGSYICHCRLGFSPLPEDHSRCQDTDECQIPGTCQQMCVNYEGGFECHCEEGHALQPDNYSCKPISETDGLPSVTPSYFPWDSSLRQVPDFHWPQWPDRDSHTVSPYLAWPTDTDLPSMESLDQEELANTPQEETNSKQTVDWLTDDNTPGWDELDSEKQTQYPLKTSPSSTLFPNWSEAEITENPSTPFSPSLSPATSGESNAPRVTAHQDLDHTETKLHDGDNSRRETAKGSAVGVDFIPSASDWQTTLPPVPTFSLIFPTTHTQGFPKQNDTQHKDNTLLLVALLVPLLLIVVALVVLGIVYGTRCGVRQRSKTTSECYYWISGSGEKVDTGKSQI